LANEETDYFADAMRW